jgi:hypothetical protein
MSITIEAQAQTLALLTIAEDIHPESQGRQESLYTVVEKADCLRLLTAPAKADLYATVAEHSQANGDFFALQGAFNHALSRNRVRYPHG